MATTKKMRIIVIGAGLGGLTAAIRFSQKGHDVQVFERRPGLSEKGSGVMLRPGASRILRSWGLGPDFEAVADDSHTVLLKDLLTGEVAMRNVAVEVSPYPDWGLPRQVLQDVIYTNAVKAGAKIYFNVGVKDIEESDSEAVVTLKDGSRHVADLILAADGIRSRMRPKILADIPADSIEPIVGKTTFYGTVATADQIRNNKDTKKLDEHANLMVYMGQDGFVVARMAKKCGQFGCLFGVKSETTQQGLWDEDGDIEYVRNFFSDICPELKAVLQMAKKCDRWKLAQMPDLPRWTSKHGRMILLGDSAHAMEPNAAQGFSQIIEDVAVLDYLLEAKSESPLPSLMNIWQKLRKPRAERIKAYAAWNTRMFLGEPLAPTKDNDKQNIKSLKDVKPDMHASFHSSAFLKWAHDFDAVGEARKYVELNSSKL